MFGRDDHTVRKVLKHSHRRPRRDGDLLKLFRKRCRSRKGFGLIVGVIVLELAALQVQNPARFEELWAVDGHRIDFQDELGLALGQYPGILVFLDVLERMLGRLDDIRRGDL